MLDAAVDIASVKMSMNPFCEIAVEEAVRLKEKKIATEVRLHLPMLERFYCDFVKKVFPLHHFILLQVRRL